MKNSYLKFYYFSLAEGETIVVWILYDGIKSLYSISEDGYKMSKLVKSLINFNFAEN